MVNRLTEVKHSCHTEGFDLLFLGFMVVVGKHFAFLLIVV